MISIKRFFSVASIIPILFSCRNYTNPGNDFKNEAKYADTVKIISDNQHNAENSLDWAGTYEGMLPCADCEGIKTTIQLKEDKTFTLSEIYLKDKSESRFDRTGIFEWDKSGSIILLKTGSTSRKYLVGENKLIHLDMNGKIISGKLADLYVLKKK